MTLINQDGRKIKLKAHVDSGKTVIIDFISTSCTAICSVLSGGFSNLRDELGAAAGSLQLISISTDPEHDSPELMKEYLGQYNSGEGWDFLTGSLEDISRVLKAFNAEPPGKRSALPLYVTRGAGSDEWVRINGLTGAAALMGELRRADGGVQGAGEIIDKSQTEDYCYENAKATNTAEYYAEYIRKFPKGNHIGEVKQGLAELESAYYAKAKGNKDFSSYQEYLITFPEGRYASEMKDLMNKSYPAMMEFVPVKGGCFQMGDTFGEGAKDEKPGHEVCVDDFSIGKYDVTVRDFRTFVSDSGYKTGAEKDGGCYAWAGGNWKKNGKLSWRNAGFVQDDRHPVVCVSWNDAVAFADWFSGKSGRKYRLPTEAEWEYAARSGGKKEKYAGFSEESQLYLYANFCDKNCDFAHKKADQDDGYKFTSPVGSCRPNGLGLYDMTGNVLQWANDMYSDMYYEMSPKDNPPGPDSGQNRSLRGGSWFMTQQYIRTTSRSMGTQTFRFDDIGFRLVSSGRPQP